ncbi:hypothetical protein [Ehrlichia muris]|uniref:Uncharacterized protein n=1 Tax=Ehrlichia muris AS145 TaxID=1423892 RepID=V9R8W4_9RICK|nr:hypothetical protein [Ehrlichia muris]AHC39743.1 hypothetical protein EMUR_03795 [Ehrlichia muris AS145]
MRDIMGTYIFAYVAVAVAIFWVVALIVAIVCYVVNMVNISKSAREEVYDALNIKLKEFELSHNENLDKNLVKVIHAMDYISDQLVCLRILEPNSLYVENAELFFAKAKMVAYRLGMYQSVREISTDEINELKKLIVCTKQGNGCNECVTRLQIERSVERVVRYIVSKYWSCDSEMERRVLCRISAASEIFDSSMQAIKAENESTSCSCRSNVSQLVSAYNVCDSYNMVNKFSISD